MAERKSIENLPLDTIWQTGRRVYLRCGYRSAAHEQIKALGAHWDNDTKAWWIGSGQRDQVVEIARALIGRREAVAEVKDAGHLISIPFEATDIRQHAKTLGAVWIPDRKLWALPTAEALAQVQPLVDELRSAAEAAQAAARAVERAEEKAAMEAAQQSTAEDRKTTFAERAASLAAKAGRTITSPDQVQVNWESPGHRSQVAARFQPGDVKRRKDGSRVLLVDVNLWFFDPDMDDDGGAPWQEKAWNISARCVNVEPTPTEAAEIAAEAQRDADKLRLDEIQRLIERTGERPDPTDGQILIRGQRMFNTGDIYGGGSWFEITAQHIWFVQNNGADGDAWDVNNVRTGGAGAIGWRIPVDPHLADELRAIESRWNHR